MNIITAYPVIMNGQVVANKYASDTLNYSSFDANGKPQTKAEIQSFQNWLDVKYPTWLNGKALNKGSGYGTFGPSTTNAWTLYGPTFVTEMRALGMNIAQAFVPGASTSTDTSLTNQQKMAKLGLFWDKAKGVYAKGKELGLFDNLLNKLGLGGGDQQPVVPIDQSGYTPIAVEPPKPGMSTTTKVLIGVGVAAVLITIVVLATRNRGTETAVKTK